MASEQCPGTLGIVLLQLGGPGSLEEVQPFLQSMFSDPDLFDMPIPSRLRAWLARQLSQWRAARARPLYAAIGGRSPIGDITRRQAELLQLELQGRLDCRVFVAMRYGRPSTDEAIRAVREASCDRLLLLPLYPQYCAATTGSSVSEWKRRCQANQLNLPTDLVGCYFSSNRYIEALTQRIEQGRRLLPPALPVHLVFSAHGLPESFVRRGDPYQRQIEETVRLVLARYTPGLPHSLCYQSRVGPQRWLRPSLSETLRRLGQADTSAVLVVPISFVSDHLETLSEIDIEAREDAARWGVREFATMPGLNDSQTFIQCLAELVLQKTGEATSR